MKLTHGIRFKQQSTPVERVDFFHRQEFCTWAFILFSMAWVEHVSGSSLSEAGFVSKKPHQSRRYPTPCESGAASTSRRSASLRLRPGVFQSRWPAW